MGEGGGEDKAAVTTKAGGNKRLVITLALARALSVGDLP